jgi:hypothetical protein
MRKIPEKRVRAFKNDRGFLSGNTQVRKSNERTEMLLHGHIIAKKEDGDLWINLCGWNTPTTRERLNGLPNVSVRTKAGSVFLNGVEIPDDKWVKVANL